MTTAGGSWRAIPSTPMPWWKVVFEGRELVDVEGGKVVIYNDPADPAAVKAIALRIADALNHDGAGLRELFDEVASYCPVHVQDKIRAFLNPRPTVAPPAEPPRLSSLTAESPEVVAFLARWHESERPQFERDYPNLDFDSYAPKTAKTRRRFIACDRGTSGRYLVERETGRVFSIKAYGVPKRPVGVVTEMFSATRNFS